MGRIINVDNQEGKSTSVLTQTGKGGLLSSGYLRDDPASAYLGEETPVFVLTNQKRGVEIVREQGREQVTPGSGYRTIAVVTDRRLLVLVGDSSHENVDGDQRLSIPLPKIQSVGVESARRGGTLTVDRSGGSTVAIHTAGSGLDEVAAYLETAATAWRHVETTIDGVTRALVTALDRRDSGEYDDALDGAQAAIDQLEDARRTAGEFTDEWPGTAMLDRVQGVDRRCKNTEATVRVGRARQFADRGERRWRQEDFEGAHDAYDRAMAEYDAARTLPASAVEDADRVEAEARRLEGTIERLEAAPLQAAIEADRAAEDADDPVATADHLETAIDLYQRAVAVDEDADGRRFDGDPRDIERRLTDVVEDVTAERRKAGTDAKQAGEWYIGTEQYDLAVEEFETAREQFQRAIEVATDHYPDAVDHLEADLAAVEESLERAEAERDGEHLEATATGPDGGEPNYDVAATIGSDPDEADPADERGGGTNHTDEGADSDGETPAEAETLEARFRRLDEARFGTVVATVLSETGWTVEASDDDILIVRKESPSAERMLVRLFHRPDGEPVGPAAIETCDELRRERASVDAVMMATSAGITNEATRLSREREVRLLDAECLAAVVESRSLEDELTANAVELD
jgi:tetratricopeptide (TPR) repeat protein